MMERKMLFLTAMAAMAAMAITGCASTKSVVTEFDKDGKVVKTTETSDSVVKTITESTKDKTVIAWESGWAAYISASTATTEDPTPTVRMFAGKTDKGLIFMHKDQQSLDKVAEVINATKYELTVSKDGIGSQSAKSTETAKPTEAGKSAVSTTEKSE